MLSAVTARCAGSGVNATNPASALRAGIRGRLGPERVAFALLLAALATVFVGYDRGTFYRSWLHNAVSSNYLTIAANLSPDHDFLGFRGLHLNKDGEYGYEAYNRFPVGGHLLNKAAMMPFANDLSAQIRAARMLMVAFFAAAAVVAYLSLLRLTARPNVALATTLLGFSSFPALYYSDMIATEGSIDLFAVMLTFHGMVVFTQEGRFWPLVLKTCVALLLGWHVLALLLPFVVFGFVGGWLRQRRNPWFRRLWESRHLRLGAIVLGFGAAVLAVNFAREYAALAAEGVSVDRGPTQAIEQGADRETPRGLMALPSFESMGKRLGWDAQFNERNREYLAWNHVLRLLFERAAAASIPRCLTILTGQRGPNYLTELLAKVQQTAWAWGVVASCMVFVAVVFSRHRVLLASLAAPGFCWGVLARHEAVFHAHEGMFFIGLPLVFFSLALGQLARLSRLLVAGCAAAAVLLFVVSSLQTNRLRSVVSDQEAPFRAMLSDFDAIRDIARPDARVLVPYVHGIYGSTMFSGAERSLNYYLSGRPLVVNLRARGQTASADFLLTRERAANETALLTPHNRQVFLYDRAAFHSQYAQLADPVAQGGAGWNVHAVGTRLVYTTGESCAARQGFTAEAPFFVEILDAEGNPATRWNRGKPEPLWFRFHENAFEVAGRCLAEIHLPAYADDIHTVKTGQLGEGAPSWHREFTLPATDGKAGRGRN